MEGQEGCGAHADRDLPDPTRPEKERPEPARDSVAHRQVRRPLARPPEDDQLLLEQEILSDHRADSAWSAELRGRDRQVEEGEQGWVHTRDSVGQTAAVRNRRSTPATSE